MKLMFASDIHGSAFYCKQMIECYRIEKAEKLILLGDLLYHGPRNDLPKEYNPKAVIGMLNEIKEELLCVRGNCDAEVDQMVLEFPIMADYMTMFLDNRMLFITHGHLFHEGQLPPLKKKDILIHGHTHVQAMVDRENYTYINPGSVSLPKEENVNSYMIYENGVFQVKDLNQNVIKEYIVK
ncbi:phosphodiesterase [Anaeromicropila herbilytica]|uniref:Phosphoesterase n=1 Tax=Anaeromicropila herbilytica TaxID=2785025 RepID=A0A7R7IFA3_9FIRM|nr:phosphodiesterase [Anaeromicropila herbilytica]BCN32974.1 phosphoesterase [Anaeromicropila herbilytica]